MILYLHTVTVFSSSIIELICSYLILPAMYLTKRKMLPELRAETENYVFRTNGRVNNY